MYWSYLPPQNNFSANNCSATIWFQPFLSDDTAMECFSSSIKYLPSLTSLNFSCNGITSNGFATFSKGLASGLRFGNADQIDNSNVSLTMIFLCRCDVYHENNNAMIVSFTVCPNEFCHRLPKNYLLIATNIRISCSQKAKLD